MSDSFGYSIEPFFLPFGQESIFCLYVSPSGKKPRGGILYLPPFAEEMHKSRRMAALQARQFAQAGYAVLLIDLLGCGDSSGDFEDANWESWIGCGRTAHAWLAKRTQTTVFLWGLRLGAMLAAELSLQLPEIGGLIFWQPVTNGEAFLNQFLRIKVASEMFAPNQEKSGTRELLSLLESGKPVEVGGYMLAPGLASQLAKLRLGRLTVNAPVSWLEVSEIEPLLPPPASVKIIDAWTAVGVKVTTQVVPGTNFWSSQEIQESPTLLLETSRALENIAP